MRKGEQTRERIIERAAPLFNEMGFFGASMSDIMGVTGLKKGGIYNHFESKEDLALQSFEYSIERVAVSLRSFIDCGQNAVERLGGFGKHFASNFWDPTIPGGCPLLNSAIESDDAHPALRERVQVAMDRMQESIVKIVVDGVSCGQLLGKVEPEVVATRLIATLEGGLMMSRLYGDPVHIDRAIAFIDEYVQSLIA